MVMTRERMFEALEEIISGRTVKNVASIPGIDADRADIIVGGAIVLEQILQAPSHKANHPFRSIAPGRHCVRHA
jgi:exopolyphosphatase/pppGpp-phosphohydrolase